MSEIEAVFRSGDPKRDNFLSRVFGIFSEEVVRQWCANPKSPCVDLGRPTLYTPDGRRHTLDFTFHNQETGGTYIAEMKCELAYDGYRYLRLIDAAQLDHHQGAAFLRFLELTNPDHNLVAKVGGETVVADGVMLVWGATTKEGVESVKQRRGIADVLSVEEMMNDLRDWSDPQWSLRVGQLRGWCFELFDFISPESDAMDGRGP